ncbi:phage tail tape measure protein [Modestobacter lapidis]|nr:phage tail tape measure protein [Modestobacter lapidis]
MAERTVLVRLRANVDDFKAQMDRAKKSTEDVGKTTEKSQQQASTALGRLARSAQDNRAAWDDAGMALAGFGAVTVAALGATVKAAIDWESAWAGVTKTVDGSATEMAALEGELRGLARTLPSTHKEIAAVAEAAGQLGVKRQDIAAFTKTMVDLSQTTDMSADEAATSLAQMMNVMQTAPEDVGRLGASLVALGNAGASTESEIVNMASYITGSAKLIGASESDVLALSNAMVSVGINAERGGGVMTRVMQDIYAAVQTGGSELEGFAEVAGMSSADFARAFESDPVRAIDAVVQGLNGVQESGGNVVATLHDLGYKGTQDTAVLLQMAGAGDLLTKSLDLGNQSWQENTALVEEAAKRYDTTASQLAIARNGINDAAIEIGETFLPVLADLAGGLADVAGWFADLPDPVQKTLGGLAGVAGVASLAAGAFLLVFPRVIETYKAFQTLNTTMPGVAGGLGKIGKAMGIAAGMAVLGTAVSALDSAMAPTPATMEEMTAALLDMGKSMDTAALDERFRALGGGLATEIDGFSGAVMRLTDPSNMERLNDFGGSLFNAVTFGAAGTGGGAASRRRSLEEIEGLDQALALMVQGGNADMAAKQFEVMAAEVERNGGSVADLRELLPGYQDALKGVENEQRLAAESATGLAGATGAASIAVAGIPASVESTYGSLGAYAASLGLSEDATEDLRKKTEELGSTLADFINPLGVYTSLLDEKKAAEESAARKAAEAAGASAESWQDFVTDTGFSFDEYMRRLEEQVNAQANWQTNMLTLAGRVSQGTLDELARMGPEGAPLVADLVNRSDAELDRFDDITAMRSKEATDAWGAQLTMAAPVLAGISRKAGQGAADAAAEALASGTSTIADIAAQYGITLANGVNPVLAALGKNAIIPAAPRGVRGQPIPHADGGIEDHVAQIAAAGDWRVWAEDETGGEAYIPLSPAKRPRSLDIWRETGRRLGVDVQGYAFGGINDVPRPPSTAPFQPPISSGADAVMEKAFDELRAWLAANLEPEASPSSSSGLGPRAASARRYVMDTWGIRNIGGFAKRNVYGTNTPSKHSMGKAIDVMTSNLRIGWDIANFFNGPGRRQFGVDNVIWQQSIAGRGGGAFKRMPDRGSPTQNHMDHPHIDFLARGGLLNPHVRDMGGPLLPGYTFNGTGSPETVVPNGRAADSFDVWQRSNSGAVASVTDARSYPVTVVAPPDVNAMIRAVQDNQHTQNFLHG